MSAHWFDSVCTNSADAEAWNAERFIECMNCGWRGPISLATEAGGRCPRCPSEHFAVTRRRVVPEHDVFSDAVTREDREAFFKLVDSTPNLDWLICTRHVERATDAHFAASLPNVWFGVYVTNQVEADLDVPKLLGIPAALHFVHCSPLGLIDLRHIDLPGGYYEVFPLGAPDGRELTPRLGWVVVAGAEGDDAKPMREDWPRLLLEQCAMAEIPFFFAGWGEWLPEDDAYIRNLPCTEKPAIDGMYRVGKKVAGRELDGRVWSEFPIIEKVHDEVAA